MTKKKMSNRIMGTKVGQFSEISFTNNHPRSVCMFSDENCESRWMNQRIQIQL